LYYWHFKKFNYANVSKKLGFQKLHYYTSEYCLFSNFLVILIKIYTMKNKILIAVALICIFATSCVKDWKCECTDGTTTQVVETYPSTKMLDAKKVCDQRESDIKKINSSVTCKIK